MPLPCLWREHRGSLAASMATQVAIEPTIEALLTAIRSTPSDLVFTASEIEISWYTHDARINQDCWMVRVPGWGVLGWISQPLTDHPCRDDRAMPHGD